MRQSGLWPTRRPSSRRPQTKIAELEEELLATQEGLREAVIQSYVSFQAPTGTLSVLGADPWENAHEEALAEFATGSGIDDIDDLRRLGEELERWRIRAAEAADAAQAHRRETTLILEDLLAAVAREAELSVAAEERVERRLYEVQTIKQIDAEYAAEIEAAERRIAEALARQRAEEEARRRAEAEAARLRAEAEAARLRAEQEAEQQPLAGSVNPDDADFTLVWVRGFDRQFTDREPSTEGLLAAMEAEGFDLGGWGYRNHQDQINLRRESHCGAFGLRGVADAIAPVPASDGPAGPQQPREGAGHRLHQLGPPHHQPQQLGVPGASARSPRVRLQEPPQRALALVGGRPLSLSQPPSRPRCGYSVWVQTGRRFSMNALGHSAPSPRAALAAITSMASL